MIAHNRWKADNEVEKSSAKSNIEEFEVISEEVFEKFCQKLSTEYENKVRGLIIFE